MKSKSRILRIVDLIHQLEYDHFADETKLDVIKYYISEGVISIDEGVELVIDYGLKKEASK